MSEAEPGETIIEDGFRRVSPPPAPLALARLRELLLDVASDGADVTRAALEGFHSWRFVSTLCGTEWARGGRRSSLAARRVLRRRLRALGARPSSFEAASALPVGSPVHLEGTVRSLHPGRATSHIWSHSAMQAHNVRLEVEEGHDFLLVEETGRTTRVIAARGHLINGERLAAGDRASVFGVTDLVLDGPGSARDQGARVLAVRAGDDAPLLIRLALPRPAPQAP
ncbi:MAG: hypothetical protein JWM82_807 [Myxococcales bacterium]|nr:hypothetical protein [Myxococcales bacterium]